ncbi:MAG: type I DNA topoisomerase [Dehalococcoidia bacterium]|nr:type I DNA topoisomerase [Dehalococcoidia bacterium]
MKEKLVIVESPAKARTLGKILGKGYSLKASLGHIRDLPRSTLGVEIDNGFTPKYVVPREKQKIVNELKQEAKAASAVYLATDPDREGEAISWHLSQVMDGKSDKEFRRVVFHEITDEAVKEAFAHPRSIDLNLVNAQQARRVLDRLVGYKLSPLLWRKVRRGLSAGRVQSVTLKIIVDREREIEKFVPVEYWVIEAELEKKTGKASPFRATFAGLMDGTKLEIHNQLESDKLKAELEKSSYSVALVTKKKTARQPAPPFITSTLQQEAWRKLHFSANRTMVIAQQLYEGLPLGDEGSVGLITYMRTDSVHVATSAIAETRDFIKEKYGAEYLPANARMFTKTARLAQEAHEAIRPTKTHREPAAIKKYLNDAQFKLYDLIWKRMVASQMSAASLENTTVDIHAKADSRAGYLFKATSTEVKFPGFIILYSEGKDETDKEDGKAAILPSLEKGKQLNLLGLYPEQRFTQPPPRYTEATLIKTLEQNGIGRPSTYAPTLSTIQVREYVTRLKGSFKPTELGFVVNDLLAEHFPDIVDIDFTARMEENLDEVAREHRNWVDVVKEFYKPFEKTLETAQERIEKVTLVETTTETCPKCGKPMVVKVGRFGKFLACSGYPECKTTKPFQIKTGAKCPECGGELIERTYKKGGKTRRFYGCSNYPKCKFATIFRPLPQPCPKCAGLLTAMRGKMAKCVKCDYKGKIEEKSES